MKTPKDFDYDLWKTADGRCMARVKATGETCEVGQATMRFLRAEEKRFRRSMQGSSSGNEKETILSLDCAPTEDGEGTSAAWLEDKQDFTETVASGMLVNDFMAELTSREREVFAFCMERGHRQQEYALLRDISISRVSKIIAAIRKKAKIFFQEVSSS